MNNFWNTPEEFERFYRGQHIPMVLYASKIVYDIDIAKDIVQEVFLKTWENREKIEINTSPETYLFRAVRNQCINFIRHKYIHQKFANTVEKELRDIESDYYAKADESILKIFSQETGEILKATVSNLPDKCREIFEMSRYNGLKNSEIAQRLNISLRTVETQIYRALKELKSKLKNNIPNL